jgi:hypothetical protein
VTTTTKREGLRRWHSVWQAVAATDRINPCLASRHSKAGVNASRLRGRSVAETAISAGPSTASECAIRFVWARSDRPALTAAHLPSGVTGDSASSTDSGGSRRHSRRSVQPTGADLSTKTASPDSPSEPEDKPSQPPTSAARGGASGVCAAVLRGLAFPSGGRRLPPQPGEGGRPRCDGCRCARAERAR